MRIFCVFVTLGALIGASTASTAWGGTECEKSFDGTYDLIQEAIFENKGCTAGACHGQAAAGGLDLRADVSYDNLVGQPALTVSDETIRGLQRVVPGQKDQSLLFINLAAATSPEQWTAPLRPMPIGVEALSPDELEAVREWIEQGAPREGTVPGTGELLDACLPPARPIEIPPLPVPDPEVGRQIRMPRWTMPAQSEDEVCFASYFDISEGIPERFLSPDGEFFRYNRSQIRQDPLSHHLIVTYYTGEYAYDHPGWGEYKCRGGDREGESCEPTDLEFCGEGLCGSEPRRSIACIGFGPPDAGTATLGFPGTQEASFEESYPPGAFEELPTKGLLIWNSHAFNLTDEAGKLEAWINFDFAEPEDQINRAVPIFNSTPIFKMRVPPFEQQEVCHHNVFPANTRLFELNSHSHQRGKRFRVYEGRWACSGGSNAGQPCAPDDGEDPELPALCGGGGTCERSVAPDIADCNGNGNVDISDLTRCVNISLGAPVATCPAADPDGDGEVPVNDLVRAVRLALDGPQPFDGEPELLYTNLVYNDPTVVRFDPPRAYPGPGSNSINRTLTFCNLYDNGFNDPDEVKRRSTSPPTPFGAIAPGGPCRTPTGCTEGQVGAACSGNSQAQRDASCDSSPGAGDGFCDACLLRGGVTTEDEMFILMGGYFVETR